MLHHRPMHPEHQFVRDTALRSRTPEVAISISNYRGPAADASPRGPASEPPRNRLLAALSPIEQELLAPHLERTMLVGGQRLTSPHTAPTYIYFPETAVVALEVRPMEKGRPVDVATVGSEGMIGISHILGGAPGPETAVTRVAGSATRIAAAELDRVAPTLPGVRARLLRYAASLVGQMAQTALCVQAHTIEQRLASLILLTADRIDHAPIVVTHEELGQMLGIRRPGVTQVAATLRERGLIGYRRGKIVVTDRDGLLGASCPCYGVVWTTLVSATQPEGGGLAVGAAARPVA